MKRYKNIHINTEKQENPENPENSENVEPQNQTTDTQKQDTAEAKA